MPTVSESLAKWVSDLEYKDIPSQYIESARYNILDMFGCGLFGSTRSWVKPVFELVKEWGGKEEATIWGHDIKVPSINAVLANANAVNSFEFDDTYFPTGIHPGAFAVTAALASTELTGQASGKEFITAVVAGHEISARIRNGLGWSVFHGWNGTAICSTFGAAVASAKIFELNEDQITNAIGIAGPYVGGLLTYGFKAMVKRVVNARSAQGGMYAALLAQKGFTGYRDILESKQGGFCTAHSSDPTIEKITENLGQEYEMRKMALKKYPTCTSFHAVIDALSGIPGLSEVNYEEIMKVVVNTTDGARKNDVGITYDNISSAQMSMSYAVAAKLSDGAVGVEQFTEEKIADEKIRNLSKKIEIVTDPELEKLGLEHRLAGQVDIFLKNGNKLSSEVIRNPRRMSPEEVKSKFMNLALTATSKDRAERLVDIVENMVKHDNIITFAELLMV